MLHQQRAHRAPIVERTSHERWHARIAKLRFGLVALAVTFGGLTLLQETAELQTPIETWIGYVGFTVSGLSAVVTQVIGKAGATLRDHPRFVFWVLVAVNAIYLVVAAIMVLTHDDLMEPSEPVDLVLAAGAQEQLRFRVDPGDHVVVRVRASEPGRAVSVRARNGARDEPVELVDPRNWVFRGVLEGGVWRLVIDNDGDVDVALRAVVTPIGGARSLSAGSVVMGEIASRTAMSGYLIRVDEAVPDARLLVEPSLRDDLLFAVNVFVDTQPGGIPVPREDGSTELALTLDPGRDYVVAVRALDGAIGRYRISLFEPDARVDDGSLPQPGAPVPAAGEVALPDLYELTEGQAFERLHDAGFQDIGSIPVCSSSVDEGLVRQAFVLSSTGREVVVADRPDLAPSGSRVDVSEPIRLKISTGQACG